MKVSIQDILQLSAALQPFVVPTAQAVMGAIKGSGAETDAAADADLQALIEEALAAKAEADKAAQGLT